VEHHPLIETIAVALVLAAIGGFLAARLRLPPLLGYLLAGIAVGPFTPGFVADAHLAPELAEIGVILLMFGVGMHFSLGDLLAVRTVAIPGALGQIAVATGLGAGLSMLWGWSLGTGLVFGLALSVASTVVLLRALEAQGALDSAEGRIAIGWLVVEDVAMILVLVLLPTVAPLLQDGAGSAATPPPDQLVREIATTIGKVGLLVVLVVVVGRRVVPRILVWVDRTGSRELFTLAIVALALGVAFGSAEIFGTSFALGAFFAGTVLHHSDFDHRATATLQPFQDAFAALFFVAAGMLLDPGIVVRDPLRVASVLAIIMIGKSLAACAIVLALRRPLRTALMVSAALSQIGEFSFILAALGVRLSLLTADALQLIVAGALLSIALNPLTFRIVAPPALSRTHAARM
jgi:CPA2 family monovalent cation:H+ antiporter-2